MFILWRREKLGQGSLFRVLMKFISIIWMLHGYVYWAENLQYVHSSKCMSYFTTYWSTHLFSYDRTKIQPFRSKSCDLTIFFIETPCFGTGVCNDSYIIAKASEKKEKQVMETSIYHWIFWSTNRCINSK